MPLYPSYCLIYLPVLVRALLRYGYLTQALTQPPALLRQCKHANCCSSGVHRPIAEPSKSQASHPSTELPYTASRTPRWCPTCGKSVIHHDSPHLHIVTQLGRRTRCRDRVCCQAFQITGMLALPMRDSDVLFI